MSAITTPPRIEPNAAGDRVRAAPAQPAAAARLFVNLRASVRGAAAAGRCVVAHLDRGLDDGGSLFVIVKGDPDRTRRLPTLCGAMTAVRPVRAGPGPPEGLAVGGRATRPRHRATRPRHRATRACAAAVVLAKAAP